MGKLTNNPRYNVISIRISEKERKQLDMFIEHNRKSVSKVMREALELIVARAQ